MTEVLQKFWLDRTHRERAAITLAAILIALALSYAYAWLPVTRERERLLVRMPELRAEAGAVARGARELQMLGAATTTSVGLQAALRQANSASRLPDSALEVVQLDLARVRVAIANARPELALTWVARLQAAAGIRIDSIRVTSLGIGDAVRVQAVVSTR